MSIEPLISKLKAKILEIKPDFDTKKIDRTIDFLKEILTAGHIPDKAIKKVIDHNIRVTAYIVELFPEEDTILSALLHNIISMGKINDEKIKEHFSETILTILKDFSSLNEISDETKNILREKEFINFFMSKTDSFSSLFLSFANRIIMLENILEGKYPDSRERSIAIASESIRIFAAIANILGIWRVKALLEDLSFQILHPDEFDLIKGRIENGVQASDKTLNEITSIISENLIKNGINDFLFKFRKKHLYSIFQKTKAKHTDLDYLYDINGIRIILNNENECYTAMGVILDCFEDIPVRRKDFIGNPKPNGYRSIHLGINYDRYLVEVQIRTKEMDFIAEHGEAAHWVYKNKDTDDRKYRAFFNKLKRQLEMLGDDISKDSIDKDNLLNVVHIWTPDKARSFALTRGATPLDFAFCVHTDVGLQCRGAFVNGNYVPLNYELQNGDSVKIITSANQRPNIDWFKIVKTNRARKKLSHYFRSLEKKESIKKGRDIAIKEFKRNKLNFNKWIKTEEAGEVFSRLGLNIEELDKLYEMIGKSSFSINKIINLIIDKTEDKPKEKESSDISFDDIDETIVIDGMTDIKYKTAQCCNPIPGDEVIGYITSDHLISIHRTDCINTFDLNIEKLVNVKFIKGHDGYFNLFLHIETAPDLNTYTKIVNIISRENINISKSSNVIVREQNNEIRLIDLHLKVRDTGQVDRIFPKINDIQGVLKISRRANAET